MSVLGRIRRAFSRSPAVRPDPEMGRPVRGRYDAAGYGTETKNIWINADALDADASNSLMVRRNLRNRSRYERTNNGHAAGIVGTQSNYVVGIGPTLRMKTGRPGFNRMIEAKWGNWCAATMFFRKLRTMNKAKTGDGEAFGHFRSNPGLADTVKLDLCPLECDQITAPYYIGAMDENYVDGIKFDEYGNVVSYDVLDRHPGAAWAWMGARATFQTIPQSSWPIGSTRTEAASIGASPRSRRR